MPITAYNFSSPPTLSFTNMTGGPNNGVFNPTINPVGVNLSIGGINPIASGGGVHAFNYKLDGTSTGNQITGTIQDNVTTPGTTASIVAITKQNTSTWILSGTNTYTGATTITGGTLLINGNSSGATNTWTLSNAGTTLGGVGIIGGAVTAPANTVLAPGNLGQAGTLTLTNGLTLTSGYLSFILTNQNAGAYSQLFITNGAFSASGTSQIRLYPATGVISNGTYVLITNTVARTGAGNFVFAASGATNWNLGGATLTLTTNATSVVLNVTGGPVAYDVWSGTQSGTWDTTTANWANGVATYKEGDSVLFDDTATLFTVTNVSPYSPQPGSVTFNNSLSNYLVSASINGSASVTLNGSGTVTFTGTNTYTGSTLINAGTLTIGGAGELGGGNYAGAILNNGTFIYNSSASDTFSGSFSGTGGLTKGGASQLIISGPATFGGAISVTGGELDLVPRRL